MDIQPKHQEYISTLTKEEWCKFKGINYILKENQKKGFRNLFQSDGTDSGTESFLWRGEWREYGQSVIRYDWAVIIE